jgi:hypothetical protein
MVLNPVSIITEAPDVSVQFFCGGPVVLVGVGQWFFSKPRILASIDFLSEKF